MNASELRTQGRYTTNATPRKLVELHRFSDEWDLFDEHVLTPTEAQDLAQQIDSGQSPLPSAEARDLSIALLRSAAAAEASPILPEAALAVYERLQVEDHTSWSYHLPGQPGTYRLGLMAMHDLATRTGLDPQAVASALDVLLEHELIHDLQCAAGVTRQIRLGSRPEPRTAAGFLDADFEPARLH